MIFHTVSVILVILDISFWKRDLYIFITCVALFRQWKIQYLSFVLKTSFEQSISFSLNFCILIFHWYLSLWNFISWTLLRLQRVIPSKVHFRFTRRIFFYIKEILSFLKLIEFQHISLSTFLYPSFFDPSYISCRGMQFSRIQIHEDILAKKILLFCQSYDQREIIDNEKLTLKCGLIFCIFFFFLNEKSNFFSFYLRISYFNNRWTWTIFS